VTLLSNLRYSVRSLVRTPGLALALLFSIALGIGSNAVVYGFVRGLIASTLAAGHGANEPDELRQAAITPEIVDGLGHAGTLLQIAAGAVLFAACANVGAFLLARASARSRETSVRVALGSSRAQLASQLLSDSVVITAAGAAAGLLLAAWTLSILPALFFTEDAEHLQFAPDITAIAISSATAVLITIACGLLPLFEMRHDRPALVLQRESAGPSPVARRLFTGLVVAQMTCCCVLVISTGLLLESFRSALQTSTGERLGEPILATLQVRPDSASRFEQRAVGLQYFRKAEQAAGSVAGISSTAWVATLPGGSPTVQAVRIELPLVPSREVTMDVAAFTPATLELVSMPPIAGRVFGGEDTLDSCRTGVLDTHAAEALFDGDAVGGAVEDQDGNHVEIVGVVARRDLQPEVKYRPTFFYYPDQMRAPTVPAASAHFRARASTLASATIETNVVSRRFFDMMGLAPTAGAFFPDDLQAGACGVGVVNTEAADRYFGGSAVGGAVIDASGRRTEIVGVVQSPLLLSLQRRIEPTIYFPMSRDFLPRMALLLATPKADRATMTLLRRRLEGVPGAFRLPVVLTVADHLNRTALAPLRIATTLVGVSAVIALALGVLGLSGAMAEAARQRRRETALRIALGSQAWRVRRDVLANGAKLAGAGAVAGMVGALVVRQLLSAVSPVGLSVTLWAWLSAPLVLLLIVAIAGLIPARGAVMTDPLRAIRGE
jgi:FtsX-like permease family/MacB-like periplasmic core domain